MSTAITFQDVEQNAERATAFVLLIKTASQQVMVAINTIRLSWLLDSFVKELSNDFTDALTTEQANELKPLLQKLHSLLLKVQERLPSLAGAENIRERTEDLRDIIEVLVLREDPDFKNLLRECGAEIHAA